MNRETDGLSTFSVLIVDDDRSFRAVYRKLLTHSGYQVEEASDRAEARRKTTETQPTVVLLDLMLPPDGTVEAGLKEINELRVQSPQSKVVVVSGAGDTRHMVQAVRDGAYDFLTKPVDPDVLLIVVQRACARARLEERVTELQARLCTETTSGTMIGRSPKFLYAVQMAERVAQSSLPVLISGETGTGKDLMARHIHALSMRRKAPLVAVNCGALTESLLESTLFGHVKGAFTGASRDRKGLLQEADGGTVFLDEIGDMPSSLQVKLLRVLESGEIFPVGADRPVRVDLRLISATHRKLMEMRNAGQFRDDLYWRVCGTEVQVPSLRERKDDLPLLAQHFLHQCAALWSSGISKRLDKDAEVSLGRHDWPGNMRELRHEMQRATVMTGEREIIGVGDLGFLNSINTTATSKMTLQDKVEVLERQEIEQSLSRLHGNRTRAAEELGLSRQGLLNKLGKYGLG